MLFLDHLYKGHVDVGYENAGDLLALSDRYKVNDLRAQCLEVIESGLTVLNVIGLLVEAESLGIDALKDNCMGYLVLNYGKSIDEEALDTLSRPLMLELLKRFVDNPSL